MRDNGLKARQRRRFRKTTDSNHGGPVALNILDQDFSCDGPDQKWGVDISYIWTNEGWLYLAIVRCTGLSICIPSASSASSRRLLRNRLPGDGATSNRMKRDLALKGLPPARCDGQSSCVIRLSG